MAEKNACLSAPHHLHGMSWFKNLSSETLVIAGSYGDSIGRAEFSGKHLLELDFIKPVNTFSLIRPEVLVSANELVQSDIHELLMRAPDAPKYAQCEHQMQGHYMRGMIGHVMSVINNYCSVYQMFTSPKVYGYMWSLHPSLRTDEIYAQMFDNLDSKLARVPWARTNKAMRGVTYGAQKNLRCDFHCYYDWAVQLHDEISALNDPAWFEKLAIFDINQISYLGKQIEHKTALSRHYDAWFWLASFRKFAEYFQSEGKEIRASASFKETKIIFPEGSASLSDKSLILKILAGSKLVTKILKKIRAMARKWRRAILKREAIKRYPPVYHNQ
jgi:hypothetical protein